MCYTNAATHCGFTLTRSFRRPAATSGAPTGVTTGVTTAPTPAATKGVTRGRCNYPTWTGVVEGGPLLLLLPSPSFFFLLLPSSPPPPPPIRIKFRPQLMIHLSDFLFFVSFSLCRVNFRFHGGGFPPSLPPFHPLNGCFIK